MSAYNALGEHVGDGTSDILQKLSSGLSQGASTVFSFMDESKRLNAAIQTDVAAKNALGQALYSQKPGDMDIATAAIRLMDSFSSSLSPESQAKRHEAAQRMVTDARNDSDAKRDAANKVANDAGKQEAAKSSAAYFLAATEILKKIEGMLYMNPAGMLPGYPGFVPGTSLTPYNPYNPQPSGFFSSPSAPLVVVGGLLGLGLLALLFRRKSV